MEWFRQEIKKAYGGRPPKVLDPSLVVALSRSKPCVSGARRPPWTSIRWLVHPEMHAGVPTEAGWEDASLPDFILENEEFMNAFYKAHP
jgi:hypothetical protein